ncbi:MAG: DUF4160 domain-containing protein [Magnetococcales bacterium]|nr:DUF4160 domain-containing protein [Magnetococcales bacterium]
MERSYRCCRSIFRVYGRFVGAICQVIRPRNNLNIKTLALSDGRLPGRVLGLVIEWAELHRNELLSNWHSLRIDGSFHKVAPLV